MSDVPRTDAVCNWDTERTLVAGLSKELERELAAATNRIAELEAELAERTAERDDEADMKSRTASKAFAEGERADALQKKCDSLQEQLDWMTGVKDAAYKRADSYERAVLKLVYWAEKKFDYNNNSEIGKNGTNCCVELAISKADAALAAANKRADEAEKDARRYRWLRDKSVPPHNFYISVPVEFHGVRYRPDEVDSYIDEAMKNG